MNRLALTTIMLCACTLASAQVEKNVTFACAKGEITYTKPDNDDEAESKIGHFIEAILAATTGSSTTTVHHPEYADNVRAAIAGAIGNSRRIDVVGDTDMSGDMDHIDTYFEGSISAITTTTRLRTWEDKDKKKHEQTEYLGTITATIKLVDVASNTIVQTMHINTTSLSSSENWFATADKALGHAISLMASSITQKLNLTYPLYASIVDGSTAKKDKQKEVYIDLGDNFGVFKGMTFKVSVETTVAGKQAYKEIGKLKIEEVMGEEISLCKVSRGGEKIKAALDNGDILVVTSTN